MAGAQHLGTCFSACHRQTMGEGTATTSHPLKRESPSLDSTQGPSCLRPQPSLPHCVLQKYCVSSCHQNLISQALSLHTVSLCLACPNGHEACPSPRPPRA